MRKFLSRTAEFLGSFGLAAVLLILLMILVLAGTLQQGRSTIYDVQSNYFESFFVVHYWAGRYPTPLPGGLLLLPLLFVNLLLGGLIRMRKGTSTLGVFIVHVGIVVLLVGSLVEHTMSTKGSLQVWEPVDQRYDGQESGDSYQSYEEWELAIVCPNDDGSRTEYVVPPKVFDGLDADDTARVRHPDLPFDVVLGNYRRNSKLVRETPEAARLGLGVGGLMLETLDPVDEAHERQGNWPGIRATVVQHATGKQTALLVCSRNDAATFKVGGQTWGIYLRRRSWRLPFTVRLDRFVHEVHPGTSMAREFSSYVTVTELHGGKAAARKVHITMNEPLRYEGYTLYQSSWGPDGPGVAPDARLYSVFAVVENPSDKVPLISCLVIALGLLIHFLRKLVLHLRAESRRRVTREGSAA